MRGTPPGQIPFTAPSRKELVVSLPNSKAMGLTLPKSLIDAADKVIK